MEQLFKRFLHPNPGNELAGGGTSPLEQSGNTAVFSETTQNYFTETVGSKDYLSAKKLFANSFSKPDSGLSFVATEENISAVKDFVDKKLKMLLPGATTDGIMAELMKSGIFTKPIIEKVIKQPVEELIETKYISIKGLKTAMLTEEETKLVEANLLFDEIQKADIFKNEEELNNLYEKTKNLEQVKSGETLEYYNDFAGLVKGGTVEIEQDFNALQNIKIAIKNKELENSKDQNKLDRAKKIATLTERALAYGVSRFSWFGESVSMKPTSEFDDIKRGVDDILEIKKDNEESDFLGLGIDVTFRGLYSEQFKSKFFNLLKSIRGGYQTKIKYFKDSKDQPLKEFAIPKMVLYFNIEDIRALVDILKHDDNAANEQEFQNSPQKFNVMNQIVHACKKLSAFAEESENGIFRRYTAVINSLKELSWKNSQIKEMIEVEHTDEVSRRFDELISEFKLIEIQEKQSGQSMEYIEPEVSKDIAETLS